MDIIKNNTVRNAILLGSLCSISYLAVYIARNVLGAVTPMIIESGLYTEEFIGGISSTYFIFYAVGQLINGIIGDKIKARNMICYGLILAGITNFLFPYIKSEIPVTLVYGMTGFFLSMIYAPMTKVIAENTEPIHAVRCSLGYTFASFFGSPLAGVLASFFVWQDVFTISSIALWIMGIFCFASFIILEKKKIIVYGKYDKKCKEKKSGSIALLLKRNIIAFTIVSIITGVIRTTVIFWMPTYFHQHLGYAEKISTSIYSVATLIISTTTFIAIFVYEKFKRNMPKTLLWFFIISAVAFTGMYFSDAKILNIVLMVVGIMASNAATTMLWSVYCPSLKDTGMVSSATGFLDFVSYMAAAASSTLFANSVKTIGWGNLILIWAGLMLIGIVTSLTLKNKPDNLEEI